MSPDPGDPRQAALERLLRSREQWAQALRPAGSLISLRSLLREWKAVKGRGVRGGEPGPDQAGNGTLPWLGRHPLLVLGLGVAAGVGLYLARGPLLAALRLQASQLWRMGQTLLVQQALQAALNPALLNALLDALRTHAEPPPPEGSAAPADPPG